MATQAQINANRKNAKKSTGPRTARGKEVVSQNAVKHGLCAKKNVIRTESQEEFDLFQDEMIADLAPAGGMELMLAKRIVSLAWRLRRAENFQNLVLDALMDYEMSACSIYLRNARDEAKEGNIELLMGHVINMDFAKSRTLDLLLLYERRIENSLFKITAEFRKTQRMRSNVLRVSARLISPKSGPRMRGQDAHATSENVSANNSASSENNCNINLASSQDYAGTSKANSSDSLPEQDRCDVREVKNETEFAEQTQFALEIRDTEGGLNMSASGECIGINKPNSSDGPVIG